MNKLKLFAITLCTIVSLGAYASWDGTVASSYAGGDGTKDNPYQISSCAQWAYFAKCVNDGASSNYSRGKYFKLTADLVFNENLVAKGSTVLEAPTTNKIVQSPSIGSFTSETVYSGFQGTLDGCGHTVSGAYYADWGVHSYTMFQCVDGGTIKNLVLNDEYVLCGSYNASLVAALVGGNLINCGAVDFSTKSWKSNCGGLVGRTLGKCTIKNCFAYGAMYVKNSSGGILGKAGGYDNNADFTTIENCYSKIEMTYSSGYDGSYGKIGGIIGDMRDGTTIKDCWYMRVYDNVTKTVTSREYCYLDKAVTTAVVNHAQTVYSAMFAAVADTLNLNSENIPGACRWTTMNRTQTSGKAYDYPCFDFTKEITPEEETEDINSRITDPSPVSGNTHVETENGAVTLSWTASADGKTATQNIYIGTDKDEVENATTPTATIGTQTSYTIQNTDILTTYYWRVDRVTAQGKASKGDVYYFRPAHLAFPGAEGYGRFAHGGRGGKVVYVTSLADDGSEGTLRWALTNGSGPRTVMFKVSGIIDMQWKTCNVDDYVTIAAQTAPGKGIMIMHSDIGLGSDNICRFLRARRGLGTVYYGTVKDSNPPVQDYISDETGNALGCGGDNTIMDHLTLSWGTDETFSTRTSKDITFQNSVISEALGMAYHRKYGSSSNHGFAATIGGDIGTFSHNLLANCMGRNWSMGGGTDKAGAYAGRLDIFNNVCYNWGGRATDGGAMEVNFVGNYYKVGPASQKTSVQKKLFLLQIEGDLKGKQQAYVAGNVREEYDGSLVQEKKGDTYDGQITSSRTIGVDWDLFVTEPFFPSYATIDKAEDAYKKVMSDHGANEPMLDEQDQRIVDEALNRTYHYVGSRSGIYGQIDNEKDITAPGYNDGVEVYDEISWGDDYDSDNNGLPQWWEKITGVTNPNQYTTDGYTALEDYLNYLAQPHLSLACDADTIIELKDYFAGYTKSPKFSVSGADRSLIQTSLSGSKLTVKALADNALTSLTMKVSDSEGSTFERTLNIALTNAYASVGIKQIFTANEVKSCEVYTLDGKRIGDSLHGLASGIYVVKAIDADGLSHTMKAIVK